MRKPTLLILGQNPSPKDPNGILTDKSQSGRRLIEWLKVLNPNDRYDIVLQNVSDGLGGAYIPLKNVNIQNIMMLHDNSDVCIALGHVATRVLSKFTADFITLPHPSGLNRQLNDKKELDLKLVTISNLLDDKMKDFYKKEKNNV